MNSWWLLMQMVSIVTIGLRRVCWLCPPLVFGNEHTVSGADYFSVLMSCYFENTRRSSDSNTFLVSSMRATSPAHFIHFISTVLTVTNNAYILLISVFCNLPHSRLRPGYLYCHVLNPCSSMWWVPKTTRHIIMCSTKRVILSESINTHLWPRLYRKLSGGVN